MEFASQSLNTFPFRNILAAIYGFLKCGREKPQMLECSTKTSPSQNSVSDLPGDAPW